MIKTIASHNMFKLKEELAEIEKNYNVLSIKSRGVSVWPILRIYIYDVLRSKVNGSGKTQHQPVKIKTRFQLLKSILYYNPLKILKKRDIWALCSAESSKIINGNAYQKTSGALKDNYPNTLFFEYASGAFHKPKKYTKGTSIVSIALLYPISYLYKELYKLQSFKIEGNDILESIFEEKDCRFNVQEILGNFWCSYKAMKFLLWFSKPKVFVIECPYTATGRGYVKALKKAGVIVVEQQHGVINSFHYAYNSTVDDRDLSVNYMFVFGEIVKDCFLNENSHYLNKNNVYSTGHYLLDIYRSLDGGDPYDQWRNKYTRFILIAGQEDSESSVINLMITVATKLPEFAFVYVPRINKNYDAYYFPSNFFIKFHNIYDMIKYCDVHVCLYSTTSMEANYLEKYNIFLNFQNKAVDYYGTILTEDFGAYYLSTAEEVIDILSRINFDKPVAVNKRCYSIGNNKIVKEIIDNLLKK